MSTRKSLLFSFLDRYASLAISIVSSMVIARLLTPSEIGVFSVTMVLLAFVTTVRDMGAGSYLVQEKELTTDRIRAVWAVQLSLGLILACVVLLASYPVSVFYHEPRMLNIMFVISLNYAVNPFGSLTYAWLMREIRFKSIAVMRFSAALVGALVSTGFAWANYGPISLAFGSLASIVVNAILAVYFRPESFPWMPGVKEIKRVLSFGSKITGTSLVGVLSGGTSELLLGKLQDLTAVGLYSRASGLVQMFQRLFVDAVGVVCLPWFSKQSREQGGFVESYIKATLYVSACGWSFCLLVICLAHPLVRFLYGPQWDQAVDLARLLAVAAAFAIPVILGQVALLASGAVAPMARLTVLCAFQNVGFMALGAYLGLWAIGFAAILSAIVASSLWLRTTSRHVGFSLTQLIPGMRQSALVALLAGLGPFLVLCFYGPYPEAVLLPLFLGSFGGIVGFVAGVYLFQHPLQEELGPLWVRLQKKLR